jgi:hypothetical protein
MIFTARVSKNQADRKENFNPFPEGQQAVRIKKIEAKTSKAGNEMLVVTMEHVATGSLQRTYLLTQEGRNNKLLSLLEALGKREKNSIEDATFDTAELINQVVDAECVNEVKDLNFNGFTTQRVETKVKFFKPHVKNTFEKIEELRMEVGNTSGNDDVIPF